MQKLLKPLWALNKNTWNGFTPLGSGSTRFDGLWGWDFPDEVWLVGNKAHHLRSRQNYQGKSWITTREIVVTVDLFFSAKSPPKRTTKYQMKWYFNLKFLFSIHNRYTKKTIVQRKTVTLSTGSQTYWSEDGIEKQISNCPSKWIRNAAHTRNKPFLGI